MNRITKTLITATIIVSSVPLAAGTATAQTTPVMCDGKVATIVGTPGDDFIFGTDGPDVIAALQGDDLVSGLGGDDIICGGQGNDDLYGDHGFDIIFGAQGNDYLYANDSTDLNLEHPDTHGSRMFGGAGDDVLIGSAKWDRMQGGPGEDVFSGGKGRDWIRGGADDDVILGDQGVDDLHGGNGDDIIVAEAADMIRGGAGNDFCSLFLNSQSAVLRSCETSAQTPQATQDAILEYR